MIKYYISTTYPDQYLFECYDTETSRGRCVDLFNRKVKARTANYSKRSCERKVALGQLEEVDFNHKNVQDSLNIS